MRQLSETELFRLKVSQGEGVSIQNAIRGKLNQNVGNIAPNNIGPELLLLKNKSKSSVFPLVSDALALYEGRGLVRLFNLGVTSTGRTPIPVYMPFTIAPARNRPKESNTNIPASSATDNAVFMNMYRIGTWSADESTYQGLSAVSDLYTCLESGTIMYKMLVNGMADKVFSSKGVVENLTKIYSFMFRQIVEKCRSSVKNNNGDDFTADALSFVIAKFFLKYVLKKTSEDVCNSFALMTTKYRSSLMALNMFEETNMIDYSSLSEFLKSISLAFYNDPSPITLMEFEVEWIRRYGESLALAVEYAPYFLHGLIAAQHGARLGGTLKLYKVASTDLAKLGLGKLYMALISEVK